MQTDLLEIHFGFSVYLVGRFTMLWLTDNYLDHAKTKVDYDDHSNEDDWRTRKNTKTN